MVNPVGTSDFVARLRADVAARIAEIRPQVAEHAALSDQLAAINEAPPRRTVYGTRQPQILKAQILQALEARPGSTSRAIADTLDVHHTLLYAPLRALNRRGVAHQSAGLWYTGSAGYHETESD